MNKHAQGPRLLRPNNHSGPSDKGLQPRNRFPPRSRVLTALKPISASLESLAPLEQVFASLKVPAPLERISASLEAHPRPTSPHLSPPTGVLNALSRCGCHGQKVNLPHAAPLTPPGNLTLSLCSQSAAMQPSLVL
jgi:hypothetical protein